MNYQNKQKIFSGGGTDYTPLFRALIVQRHQRILSDDEFLQLLKDHVDHGFDLIRNDTDGFKSEDDYVDYPARLTRTGLEQQTQKAAPIIEATPAFGVLVDLQIGWNAETDAAVSVEFNRQTNNYLAARGQAGKREDAVSAKCKCEAFCCKVTGIG